MGGFEGFWQLDESKRAAAAQNRSAGAAALASAAESGRAEAKEAQARIDAKAGTAATAQTPDLDKSIDLSKKKRGVQSTFVASTQPGGGMAKGTTLGPVGS